MKKLSICMIALFTLICGVWLVMYLYENQRPTGYQYGIFVELPQKGCSQEENV